MNTAFKITGVAVFAALVVLCALASTLSKGLPDQDYASVEIPAAGLKFAFGAGTPEGELVQVDTFVDGNALLTSGPVNIKADELQVLQYSWEPSRTSDELAFFWRQKGNTAEVKRVEILNIGTAMFDLSTQTDWNGEIIEAGFLLGGQNDSPVAIGELVLEPMSFFLRAKLVWQDWTTYELRSQQSINFLQGGSHNQIVPLPPLLIMWLLITLTLIYVLAGKLGIERTAKGIFPIAICLFLAAWMLLDIRWTANSFQSANELLSSTSGNGANQRSDYDFDGSVFRYIQRLKNDIFLQDNNDHAERILIIGDESAIDYYLLRSKYHLLPAAAHVTGQFNNQLEPDSLDYVLYFGQPGGITSIPGWNGAWRDALKEVDRNKWGAVYKVQPKPATGQGND